jgi:hypothetical protein
MKYVFYGIIAIIVIGMVVGAFLYGRKPPVTIIQPTETHNHYYSIPATSSTDADGHEIASVDTTLVSDDKNTSVALKVDYDTVDKTFDIDATIRNTPVIIDNTKRPPFLGLAAGVGIGFAQPDNESNIGLHNAQIDAGVSIVGKYDLTAFINTEKTFGLRFGVRF